MHLLPAPAGSNRVSEPFPRVRLVKLLAGLYSPTSGRILWDDVDTAQADRHELFSRIAAISQDFKRWPFTARTNIAIGRPDAQITQQRLQTAAEHSGADEVIADLPRGGKTLLVRGFKGGHKMPEACGRRSASPATGKPRSS